LPQRPRRPFLLLITLVALVGTTVAMPSRADAVCTLSACDASALTGNASCCSAAACTIDGTLTVSGPSCTFDFGTRNLTVSGQIAAQGKTIVLKAKSVKVAGLIDVRGPSGANAGNVTIITTGSTAVAYSQEGGTSAVIDASSTNGNGGQITLQADGMVALSKGTVNANGGPAGSGGIVTILTSAGDVNVQIPVTASSGASATLANGQVLVTTPGNLTVGGSGRFVVDLSDIDIEVTGAVSFADGSFVQANGGGGSITLVASSLTSFGEFRADGPDGSIDLRTVDGPMFLQRLSQGITLGPGVQSLALTTDAVGAAGLLTMDMPITANGAEVEIDSGGDLVVSKKIETTGLLDSEAGDITLNADGDISISKAIVGADVFGNADLSIEGRDVTITGNIDMRGGLDTSGGNVDITADRDMVLTGDIFVNVSGADSSDGGSIDLQAARNMTVGNSVELIADGSPIGSAGTVLLVAGEGFAEHLPGNVTFQGDIKANGHSAGTGAFVLIQACDVSIPAGAVVDITGDALGSTRIVARKSLTMGGQLKATAANVVEFKAGAALSFPGTFTPARSAGTCIDGTPTADGCSRAECTAIGTPVGCLSACPTCGDGIEQFPETCEIGNGGSAFCAGDTLCDSRCRERVCTAPNSCTQALCNAAADSCGFTVKDNGIDCDDDQNICTGVGTCLNGSCRLTQGSVLQCNDHNPCTGPDTCDPVGGCQNPNRPDGPGVAGCDDGVFCNGTETCVGGACQSGALPCVPPQMCNPQTEMCEGPQPCTLDSQCDDGNPCTQNVCAAGSCTNPPEPNTTECDSDNDVCNGIRTCNGAGICGQIPTTPPIDCDDNDLCTVDSCNPATGVCGHAPTAGCCTSAAQCNDGDACTTDSCTAEHTCAHAPVVCDDLDPCTADSCVPATGCTATPIVGCQACADASTCPDDADVCTDKACTAGHCAQVANPFCCQQDVDCTDIDSNPCTSNGTCMNHRCGPTTPLTGTSCGTQCNPATCQAGTCTPGTPLNCADADLCTSDVCIEGQGCVHTPIALCCFTSDVCGDQNVCTTDSCDLDANRCVHIVPDPMCTPCTGSDPFECGPRCQTSCAAGRCQEVGPDCNDAVACTTDACDPTTGCTHTANCDDKDACTADACDPALGCTHTASPDAPGCEPCSAEVCNDDDPCTTDGCGTDGATAPTTRRRRSMPSSAGSTA